MFVKINNYDIELVKIFIGYASFHTVAISKEYKSIIEEHDFNLITNWTSVKEGRCNLCKLHFLINVNKKWCHILSAGNIKCSTRIMETACY